jgi:hypothetical protein
VQFGVQLQKTTRIHLGDVCGNTPRTHPMGSVRRLGDYAPSQKLKTQRGSSGMQSSEIIGEAVRPG